MYYYSPREGTAAAAMAGQIDEETRKARLADLISAQNAIGLEESQKLTGKTFEVLVESEAARNEGHLVGKTRTGRSIDFPGDKSLIGSFVKVTVEKARNWTLSGKPVAEEKED